MMVLMVRPVPVLAACLQNHLYVLQSIIMSESILKKAVSKTADKLSVYIPDVLQEYVNIVTILFLATSRILHVWETKYSQEKQTFINANTLKVGDDEIVAKKIIIATGSTPILDPSWDTLKSIYSPRMNSLNKKIFLLL